MDMIALGNRIKLRRKELGWTQEVLAEKVEMSVSFIGHIERGSRTASMDTIIKIANALQMSADQMFIDSLTYHAPPKAVQKDTILMMMEIIVSFIKENIALESDIAE